jgi:predicted TIM-barrel fold metal-dependent hydrolase
MCKLLKKKVIRNWATFLLRNINPFSKTDIGNRLERFIRSENHNNQEEAFFDLRRHYTEGTKFIVLPMDFEFSGHGTPEQLVIEQLEELHRLAGKYRQIIPFCPIDARRPKLLDFAKEWIEGKGFAGFKIYTLLGYFPYDSRLDCIYRYAEEEGIPIIAHCGGVSVRGRNISARMAREYMSPLLFEKVFERYPGLKFCFGHYGGEGEWKKALQIGGVSEGSWVEEISKLMKKYENIYADTSYTMFSNESFIKYLKIICLDSKIRRRVLFGTDYFLTNLEERSEKQVSIDLRECLGEDLWDLISLSNPVEFLGEKTGVRRS